MERYLLGLYEKSMPNTLSLGDKLTTAAEAGYDYMELSIDESDEKQKRLDWGADEIRTLHADMEKAGIPIGSICLSGHRKFPLGHPSTEIQEQSLDIMDRAIGLASKLGIRVIQIAGYDVYYLPSSDETVENFGRNLARSVEMAAKAGVILAFETMETPFMDTTEKAMHWVREIDSPYLQIYPDTGNVVNAVNQYGSTLSADFRMGKGHLAAVHLKESRPGVYREVPYGEGHVDFTEATRTALELGVRRFVGEFWYTGEDEWETILRNNNLFLRSAIKKGETALS